MQTHDLWALGWTAELAQACEPFEAQGLVPARVTAQDRGRFLLAAAAGELHGEPSGRLRHSGDLYPAVGDWVAVRTSGDLAPIEQVLPRSSAFVRTAVDPTRQHAAVGVEVVAANVDLVFVVTAAVGDLNLRRLERYLAAAWESGATPSVVLTKTDLVADPEGLVGLVAAAAPGAEVMAVSNLTGEGVQPVRERIGPGQTAALLGSSGVGKSSLVNRLLGHERQATFEVREDGRGRHTTTRRELILLQGGGLVLDTPGMRLFTPQGDAGLDAAFAEIDALAKGCRFKDCRHSGEPGCAVQAAVQAGVLEAERLGGWAKLGRELAHLERRDDKAAEAEHRKSWRKIHKAGRARMRDKQRGWS